MKLSVKLLCLFVVIISVKSNDEEKGILKFEEGGDNMDTESINNILKKMSKKFKNVDDEDSVGSGNDDEDSESSGSGDEEESGDGSGAVLPTKRVTTGTKERKKASPTVININYVSTTTEKTTTMSNNVEVKSTDTVEENNNVNEGEGGENEEKEIEVQPDDETGNNKRQVGDNNRKKVAKGGVNFTVGIIIGVVVGAVLAILIIVFLVYRLRKKDEGSYSLDEQSSTTYLRGDTDNPTKGKEYFA
ncbi:syndecan-2-like [Hydractinia symbiolongicarpus]|uniref:syndecan-2-like n=1 Tax=Hydractinia symbiolongicarpus TaxID=13093 RepID=UPI00254F948D|nr:syndecan-2-like [Hydractinia symbiolongicarpus]